MINRLATKLKKKKKGFTLIELIIVIAIIAIIAAIAIPNYTKIRNDSKLKADQQSCQQIKQITQALLVDGKLTNDSGKGTFDFTGSSVVVTFDGTGVASDISDYYKDVKKPQIDNASYTITINTNGVEVTNGSGKGADTGTP